MHAGWGYFAQATRPAAPEPYTGERGRLLAPPRRPAGPDPGTAEEPWLAEATALNSVTPGTPPGCRSSSSAVTRSSRSGWRLRQRRPGLGRDAGQRAARRDLCGGHRRRAEPGPPGRCDRRHPGVGNAIVYDPIPTTDAVERYDSRATVALAFGRPGRAALPVVPDLREQLVRREHEPRGNRSPTPTGRPTCRPRSTTGRSSSAWSPVSSTVVATRRSRRPASPAPGTSPPGSPTAPSPRARPRRSPDRPVVRRRRRHPERPDRPHGATGGPWAWRWYADGSGSSARPGRR